MRSTHNPTALVAALSDEELAARATPDFLERLRGVLATFGRRKRHAATWWEAARTEDDRFRGVAYFSSEFGLDESLPDLLGRVSGCSRATHLKSASDLGVPLTAVGPLLSRGLLSASQLDEQGRQVERYPAKTTRRSCRFTSSRRMPVRRPRRRLGARLVPVRHAGLACRRWGAYRLYLLDTDVDGKPGLGAGRSPTSSTAVTASTAFSRSSCSDSAGVRVLRALGLEPTVFHLNEGALGVSCSSSACASWSRDGDLPRDAGAAAATRRRRWFTTHHARARRERGFSTPYSSSANVAPLVARCGLSWDEFAALGPRPSR